MDEVFREVTPSPKAQTKGFKGGSPTHLFGKPA